MKKGFTLIEMLGIITVLAILLLITYPNLSRSLKEMKDNKTKNFTNNLKVSTESYVELNRNKYPELYKPYGRVEIKIQELYDANLMSGQPENASMNDTVTVLATENLELKYFFNNKQIGYGVNPDDNSLNICDNQTTFCITSRSDLEQLATLVNNGDNRSGKTYILTQNIDLGGLFDASGTPQTGNNPWTPIGSSTNPFSGTFDGAGHIITGIYIDSSTQNTGLFSYVDGGIIKNLGIENSYVKSSEIYTGSIAGGLASNGVIMNCYNNATISGQKDAGGIVGQLRDSIIKNCYNMGEINSNGQQFTAGIVGYETSLSVIENCYNTGTIITTNESGGIVGGAQGKVLNNYNIGTITTTSGNKGGGIAGQLHNGPTIIGNYNKGNSLGGIIGYISPSGTQAQIISENYFLNTSATYGIRQTSSNTGAEPLTIDKMPTVISVINGDNAFVEDKKGINGGYPILKWQQ